MLYRAIYLVPPLAEWGFYRVVTLPIWRMTHPDGCNLAVRVKGKEVKEILTCVERWGFEFISATPYGEDLVLWAKTGALPTPQYHQHKPIQALGLLPGPRLLMNSTRNHPGWQRWTIYGWPKVDPYAYPVRQNYVDVNFTLLSLVQEAKEAHQTGAMWRFRVGDLVNQMVAQGMSKKEIVKLIAKATTLSKATVELMALVAEKTPIAQRGISLSWKRYVQLAKEGSNETAVTTVGTRSPNPVD